MKKSPNKTGSDANAFKVPGWFRRLWNGTLFGRRKDELILRILELGGKGLLMSQCRLRLDMDMIDAAPAPSMKLLLAVLRKAKSERREMEKSLAKGASIFAHPEDYNKEKEVLINRKDLYCAMEMWTPKQPSAKRRKHDSGIIVLFGLNSFLSHPL